MTEKIGIYGGTFAPPHLGHLRAANAFFDSCALDTLYILPTAQPPHKSIRVDDNPIDRLTMCRLMFTGSNIGNRNIVVSDYEQQRGGKSYTILTLEHFRTLSEDLYLLCGTDMFLTLDTWYRGTDILQTTKICCLSRDPMSDSAVAEKAAFYRAQYDTTVLLPTYTPLITSSTEIRNRIRCGMDTDQLLSPAVRAYIDAHRLYSDTGD